MVYLIKTYKNTCNFNTNVQLISVFDSFNLEYVNIFSFPCFVSLHNMSKHT